MKKLLTICLCIVLSLSLSQGVCAVEIWDTSSEQSKIIEEWNALSQAQAGAVEAWDIFFKTFLRSEPDAYPESYGGSYIEDNLLHICFVNLEQQDVTPYEAVLADYLDVVRFVEVDYSIRTLDRARDLIREEFRSLGIQVVSAGIGNANNAVSLGVTPETVHKLPSFITLGEKSMHPTLQVPIIVSEEGIPTLLTGDTPAPEAAHALPAYVPVLAFTLFVLVVAGIILLKRKR